MNCSAKTAVLREPFVWSTTAKLVLVAVFAVVIAAEVLVTQARKRIL